MEYSNLLWLSGNDIPFPEAQLTIHTPTIKEIGYIGEDDFFIGCNLLNFNKDSFLNDQDKKELANATNFDILMSILSDNSATEIAKGRNSVMMLLALLFPDMQISLINNCIQLQADDKSLYYITNENFEIFRNIITSLFCLKPIEKEGYKPKGALAKKIAEKLEKGRQKIAKQKGEDNKKISVLSNYVSILATGESKDMNQLLNYSVYQLYDEFERYQLKLKFDMHTQAAMAGAKLDKEAENWMQDIHSPDYKKSE